MKPGSYSSGVTDLSEYYTVGARIYLIEERSTRNVLMLGLVYDFMAFVSLGYVIQTTQGEDLERTASSLQRGYGKSQGIVHMNIYSC